MKIKVTEREILSAGYRRAYIPVSDGTAEALAPGTSRLAKLAPGQRVKPKKVRTYRQGMTEAGLIAALQKNGIGRPATYALIIEMLIQRKYVENTGGHLLVTSRGKAVLEFLLERYPALFSIEFTAKMEKALDDIAEGKKSYGSIVGRLWGQL